MFLSFNMFAFFCHSVCNTLRLKECISCRNNTIEHFYAQKAINFFFLGGGWGRPFLNAARTLVEGRCCNSPGGLRLPKRPRRGHVGPARLIGPKVVLTVIKNG